jgi:hypothetical protein
MNLEIGDLIRDKLNTYQVLGFAYDNYCKQSGVRVRCIRGPHIGTTRDVGYSTVKAMFDEGQLFVVDKSLESV